MPFKCDPALQNIPLSKQPFKPVNPKLKMKTSLQVFNIAYLAQEPTSKHRALSIQEVELDDGFSILHIVLETCTMHDPCTCFI